MIRKTPSVSLSEKYYQKKAGVSVENFIFNALLEYIEDVEDAQFADTLVEAEINGTEKELWEQIENDTMPKK